MIDFHSHILPGVDDGADSVMESLTMLRESWQQGVEAMVSTCHFYADQDYPRDFLQRRNKAFQKLQKAMEISGEEYPQIILGAEVLYFPGISEAEEIASLQIGDSGCILIEPPMAPWSEEMLDEIAQMGENFGYIPVIAHVDRFMYMLRDKTLMARVRARGMLVQANADYFLNPQTMFSAVRNLKNGYIQLVGSDCHNLTSRPPNLGLARKRAALFGAGLEFDRLQYYAAHLLQGRGNAYE